MSRFDSDTVTFMGRQLERFEALGWKPDDDLVAWLVQQAEGAEKLGAMLGAEANRTLAQKARADAAMKALRGLVDGVSSMDVDGLCHWCEASAPAHAADCPWVAAVSMVDTRSDTDAKVKVAWEWLFNERDRLWREEADRVGAVKLLLEKNGCDCDCDHDAESHDSDCDRCLACRISWAIET